MEAAIGIAVFIGWLLCIRWARNTAMDRGHSRYLGLVLGFFLGPLGVLILHRLSPTGGKVAYLGCGTLVAVAGALGVIVALASASGSSTQPFGFLIMALVVLATGIGLIYRGSTGKEAKLPEDIANPITATALEATAQGLMKGPGDAVLTVAQNIPEIYHSVKEKKTTLPSSPSQLVDETVLAERKSRIVSGLCPKCGSSVTSQDQNCPSCRINLGYARDHLGEW